MTGLEYALLSVIVVETFILYWVLDKTAAMMHEGRDLVVQASKIMKGASAQIKKLQAELDQCQRKD